MAVGVVDGLEAVGDALLQAIALRLTAATGPDDLCARTGGDEFAIVLAGRTDPLAARAVADHLLDAFRAPFRIAGHTVQVGLSIGVAVAPLDTRDGEQLLVRADLALLAAKRDGGRRVRFFDRGLTNQLAARRLLKDEVRRAGSLGQWTLFYQPQRRLADGALAGVEALLRWRHPARGLLAPGEFLAVLEGHAVAYEVGGWVLTEACRQLVAWRDAGLPVPRVGINLFAAQLASGTLAEDVARALEEHALTPDDLELEVTETVVLRPGDAALSALARLRDAGVHVALDDFGTGFASLATLKQLPVSRLKIDRSFVTDICEERHSAAIVAAVVSLADRLDLEVVAEGIETTAQRAALLALGCSLGQGYLLGRPADADALLPERRIALLG